MIRRLVIVWLVLMAIVHVVRAEETKVIIARDILGVAVSASQLGLVPGDPDVPATYTDGGAGSIPRINAQKLQEWRGGPRSNSTLIMPAGKWYAIADHDGDGIGVLWKDVIGLKVVSAGGTSSRNYWTEYPAMTDHHESVFVWVGDPADTMFCLEDFRGCYLELSLRGAYAVSHNAAVPRVVTVFGSSSSSNTLAARGLWLRNAGSSSSSGKSHFRLQANLCDVGCWIDNDGSPDAGPDHIVFDYFGLRHTWRGCVIDAEQAVHFTFVYQKHSGSSCESVIELLRGGDVLVVDGYAGSGPYFVVKETITSGAANLRTLNLRFDQIPINSGAQILVSDFRAGPLTANIAGSCSGEFKHKAVDVVHLASGWTDVQLDLHRMGFEAESYPQRPGHSRWVDKTVYPLLYSTSGIYVDFDDRRKLASGWSIANEWQRDATQTINVAADLTDNNNDLTPDGTTPTISRGQVNHRDSADFGGTDRLICDPAGELGSAFDDLSFVVVFQPDRLSGTTNRLVGCRNADNTGGWAVDIDGTTDQVTIHIGAESETLSATVIDAGGADRYFDGYPNILIFRRDASAGRWYAYLNNNSYESFSGKSTATIGAIDGGGRFHVGMRQTGASSWDSGYEGRVGLVHVDEQDWDDGGTLGAQDEWGQATDLRDQIKNAMHFGGTCY